MAILREVLFTVFDGRDTHQNIISSTFASLHSEIVGCSRMKVGSKCNLMTFSIPGSSCCRTKVQAGPGAKTARHR